MACRFLLRCRTMMRKLAWLVAIAIATVVIFGLPAWATSWEEIQQIKVKDVTLAAQHAMEQQKTTDGPTVQIRLGRNVSAEGGVTVAHGKHGALSLAVNAAPYTRGQIPSDLVCIKLSAPVDFYTGHSGLAILTTTAPETSPEVRVGVRFLTADGMATEVQPVLPVLSKWGDATQELYFDWSYLDYADAGQAVSVLKSVAAIEITFGAVRRAPEHAAPSAQALNARISLSDLRLVDYLKGSYDSSRQSLKLDQVSDRWIPSGTYDLTLQHRTQEVTGIVARFGGATGIQSAIDSLDMAARTQCWDGSFIDTRRGAVTAASGEYTFGFTLYGLLQGYRELEKIHSPLLDQKITIGAKTNSRRWFYLRMFYRGAMARTAALPSAYRDDIISGNTLVTGANRVLGYAIAMRMIADVLADPIAKKQVLEKYGPIMQEIADAQGKYSASFPILGEGDRYGGRGIHYDAGYTRTHMDWLVLGAMDTGDPLLVQMLTRYQTVFEAVMDQQGSGLLPMLSERGHHNTPVQLVIPDVTAQVGMKFHLPVIAQWGYNCSAAGWANAESQRSTHFGFGATSRGYPLGALISILSADMHAEPIPKDLGYLFPRQFPTWSTRTYSKDGALHRTSSTTFHPDGTETNDYQIEVGEYPVTVGVPVMIHSTGKVTAVAESLSGWPKLLPADGLIQISDGDGGVVTARLNQPVILTLSKETRLVLSGPGIVLPPEAGGATVPFRAELSLTPERASQTVELTILRGTVSYQYTALDTETGAGR